MKLLPIKSVNGVVHIPCSKSEAQRAILIASLLRKPIKIEFKDPSDDIKNLITAFTRIGCKLIVNEQCVEFESFPEKKKSMELDIAESGFAFRALASIAMHWTTSLRITGQKSLLKRDFIELENQLKKIGLNILSKNGKAPFKISGSISSGNYQLDSSESSQSISGLLIALANLPTPSIITFKDVVSFPYVQLTMEMLTDFGYNCQFKDSKYILNGHSGKNLSTYTIRGDWSCAVVWFAAAALKGEIQLVGLPIRTTQPDEKVLTVIRECGAEVMVAKNKICVKSTTSELKPFSIDLKDNPDLFPVMAVFACGIRGVSEFYSIDRLRNKESNRLTGICNFLDVFNVKYSIEKESIKIFGTGNVKGGHLNILNDHRLAMAAALASCICEEELFIQGEECVLKSYPTFFDHWSNSTNV